MAKQPLKVIFHDLYLTDYPTASCETPDRVLSVMQTLRKKYPVLEPTAASDAEILMVHTESILKSVKMDPDVYTAAAMAAGGAIMAAGTGLSGTAYFRSGPASRAPR